MPVENPVLLFGAVVFGVATVALLMGTLFTVEQRTTAIVQQVRRSVPGTTARDVMNLVLMTQYFDMLKDIGASSRTNAILIPHAPGSFTSLTEQMRNAMIEADQAVHASHAPTESQFDFVGPDGSGTPQGRTRPSGAAIPANGGRTRPATKLGDPHE